MKRGDLHAFHQGVRLGRNPRKFPVVKLANYLNTDKLPAPPLTCSWIAASIIWTMLANDTLGDCTCAAFLHMVQVWCAAVGVAFNPTDAMAIWMYSQACGYVPGNPATDQGGDEVSVLKFCQSTGVAGHKIEGFAAVNPQNLDEVKQAIYLFGGVYSGLSMPLAWQGQTTWDAPSAFKKLLRLVGVGADWTPGSWGGHATPWPAYDANGNCTVITWGSADYRITPRGMATYCDELYALVSSDFLNVHGVNPDGFNKAQLLADLQGLAA